MTSAVDATIPADNVKASKADFRSQLLIIKNEITALQNATAIPALLAYGDHTSKAEVQLIVDAASVSYARDIAFGRVPIASMDTS